ncbi:MAG: ureidoglycolate lyase [Pseudomonadota bacterium]|nr:ureidoglycolate lyase [Pseudomonadota bacterium]MEE3099762.1 ureidoglycolate lyase [Pseudomonadota bacterium]
MRRLVPAPLTAEGFAPFGSVIEADPASAVGINAGFTTRFHGLAEIEAEGGAPILSIFRGRPRPLVIDMLERHPMGSQAFMPLGGHPWLVVCAEAPGAPLHAFLCRGDQGAQIGRGVWHFPLLTLGTQDFLVADRASPETNVEVADLAEPAELAV